LRLLWGINTPPPPRADNRRGSRLHTPDTSTANRPFPNPFGCKPRACGHAACLPARMGWGGKSGIFALARASGQSPPHGGDDCALGTRGRRPRCSRQLNERRRSASLSPNAVQERHPCTVQRSRTPCARACAPAGVRQGERRECQRVSQIRRSLRRVHAVSVRPWISRSFDLRS
jgi:hypothetical protein